MKLFFTPLHPKALLLLVLILLNIRSFAQHESKTGQLSNPRHCGSDILLHQTDAARLQQFEQGIYSRTIGHTIATTPDTQQYTIPVVFHIVHQNGVENISDQDVWDAFALLNAGFANQAPFDPSAGVDMDINFCLSPNAITRHVSSLTHVTMETDDYDLKQLGPWDHHDYINIWVVSSITSLNMGPGVAGYAMMPASHGTAIDGIVMEAAFINNDPDNVKVLLHEVGHYLGLYHTFEGGCTNTDCMTNGDRVCDTPPDNSIAPVLCSNTVNTCNSDEDDASINNPFRSTALGGLGDQPDMHQNYMDYGFQSCQTKFTDGQRIRMRSSLATIRHSLLENPTYCIPCPNPITATLNLPSTFPAGVPITLTANTSDPNLLVIWTFQSQSYVGQNLVHTFPEAATVPFTVYLIDPSSPSCNLTLRDTVVFTCPVTLPTFSVTPFGLTSPGQVITFTAPNNGYNHTWKIDGVTVSTANPFTYTVTGTQGRLVTLVDDNGTCQATSEPYYIDPNNCSASKANNTWYFGAAAGIDFNTNPPQAITGHISTEEGCSVLCDATTGLPIFHSDGSTVGNSAQGFTLQNGTGLSGNNTTTQSALFVPMPGSSQFVYLFTVDYQAGDFNTFNGGIHYSLIDRLGNSGQGVVTLKNQLLLAPVPEKVTAVKNQAGDGVWVIAHQWNSNVFYAWLVTASGIGTPVISQTGSVHTSAPNPYSERIALGEMKASPSGQKIAVAISGFNRIELFDFNNATGVLSNPLSLEGNLQAECYGLAFSPNEQFLYSSAISPCNIIRFDITSGNTATILASETLIGSANGSGGSIQLAPNGKLYSARKDSKYLAVISNPNAANPANCGFAADGFRLAGTTVSQFGLPNPVQSALLSVDPVISGPDKVCLDVPNPVKQYTIDPTGNAVYSWTHSGPNSFTVINDSTASMSYTVAGNDTLIVTRVAPCGNQYDTLIIHSGTPPPFSIGPDQSVCPGTPVILNAGPGMFDYKWNNNTYNQTMLALTPGIKWAQVVTQTGCVLRDSMTLTHYSVPSLQLGNDTSICSGQTLTLNAPAGLDSYLWTGGSTGTSITVNDSGRYVITVTEFGCTFKDSILVRRDVAMNVISLDTVVVCLGASAVYNGPAGYDTYSWVNPSGAVSATQTVTLAAPGYYVLSYANLCGSATDSIYHHIPRIFPDDTLVSCADTIRAVADLTLVGFGGSNPAYNSYILNADTIDIYRSGTYFGLIYYPPGVPSNCIRMQNILVLVDTALVMPSKTIDLGPDTSYCEGHILPLNAGSGFEWYLWNTGSVDTSITAYGFGPYSVSARYCGFDYRDTVIITRDSSVLVNLGPDVDLCPGDTVDLNAGSGFDWYVWNDGIQTQQISVSESGIYSIQAGLNACVARDTVIVTEDCPTGISKAADCKQPFYLSPNPGSDQVTLGLRCGNYSSLQVSVSGSDAKLLGEKEGDLQSVNSFMNQLMLRLNAAVYIVKIEAGHESYYFKWMIVK